MSFLSVDKALEKNLKKVGILLYYEHDLTLVYEYDSGFLHFSGEPLQPLFPSFYLLIIFKYA